MARQYNLMSADGHLEVPPERWVHRVPEKYRQRAPHTVHLPDGGDALTRNKPAGTQDNINAAPAEAGGPPLGRTSSGSMGPGFRRDSGLRVVSSRARRPDRPVQNSQ